MRIAFIGLGVMGTPMAANLIDAGHELVIHRVKERSEHLIAQGAKAAATAREVVEGAECIILMLPDTPDVEAVIFGSDGVLEGASSGSTIVDMSSISPVKTTEFAQSVEAKGIGYVDAPVSGGEVGAQNGELTIFVGGADASVGRVWPLFEILGKTVTHMGPVGAGQATKVVNQIIVGSTIEAVAEGMALAELSGIDPEKVRRALSGGFASSKILDLHGQRMVEGNFVPGFRIKLHRKDLRLAQDSAEFYGVTLPGVEATANQMDAALAASMGEKDHSALFELLKRK